MKDKTEIFKAAKKAWDAWHADIFEENSYIPEVSPLWVIAFETGARWAEENTAARQCRDMPTQ